MGAAAKARVPPEAGGINVNHCKSPTCPNFGQPPSSIRPYRRKGTAPAPGDYTLTGLGKANPALKCAFCGEVAPIRSNTAIAEEVWRQIGHILSADPPQAVACPHCTSADCTIWGKTASGTQRYRCKDCCRTFSGKPKAIARQRRSEKNRDIFMMLVNKTPLSRIEEVTGVGIQTIYNRLDFIYRQCKAFSGAREKRLLEMQLPKMYLSIDRQFYVVNWSRRSDRRTIQLNAIGSADIETGFTFGFHLNFDDSLHAPTVEAEAKACGDVALEAPYRKFARLWLSADYEAAVADAKKRDAAKEYVSKKPSFADELLNRIALDYVDAIVRDDVEASDHKDMSVSLPAHGMQVHENYTMYAHFLVLARLLKNAEKVRVYMDQDSGFRAAFMAAFANRIKMRTADGFYVKVGKDANAYQKQNAVAYAKMRVAQVMADHGLTEMEAKLAMMKVEVRSAMPMGKWKDKWAVHPLPIAAEPFKAVCWLTDLGDYDVEHAARLHLRATLHPIDRFFMQTRRRVNMAERPMPSARKQRNMWHGYGAYNPGNLAKFLEIYRVYYNYCLPGKKDKKTPAMRLGLAQAVIDPHDILYFTE